MAESVQFFFVRREVVLVKVAFGHDLERQMTAVPKNPPGPGHAVFGKATVAVQRLQHGLEVFKLEI